MTIIKNKKAAEFMFGPIIWAVLALVVLAVLIFIFMGGTGRIAAIFRGQTDTAGGQANAASWCLGAITQGKPCNYDKVSGCSDVNRKDGHEGCGPAQSAEKGKYSCPSEKTVRAAATLNPEKVELCCCSS
ncbi:MAG: hypothetical protein Q7J54_01480 [Candidatus Woesearchaeota archaeon]|nr:hypothetical protein [Candidatus Woesearchaeota archaeon]